jgi:hypothetical protein
MSLIPDDYLSFCEARRGLEVFASYDCVWHHPALSCRSKREDVNKIITELIRNFETLFAQRHLCPFPLRTSKDQPVGRAMSLRHIEHLIFFTDNRLYEKIHSYYEEHHIPEFEECVYVDLGPAKINKRRLEQDFVGSIGKFQDVLIRTRFPIDNLPTFFDFLHGAPLPRLSKEVLQHYIYTILVIEPKSDRAKTQLNICLKVALETFSKEDWKALMLLGDLLNYQYFIDFENYLGTQTQYPPLHYQFALYDSFKTEPRIIEWAFLKINTFLVKATREDENKFVAAGGASIVKELNRPNFWFLCAQSTNPALAEIATGSERIGALTELDCSLLKSRTPSALITVLNHTPLLRHLKVPVQLDLSSCIDTLKRLSNLETIYIILPDQDKFALSLNATRALHYPHKGPYYFLEIFKKFRLSTDERTLFFLLYKNEPPLQNLEISLFMKLYKLCLLVEKTGGPLPKLFDYALKFFTHENWVEFIKSLSKASVKRLFHFMYTKKTECLPTFFLLCKDKAFVLNFETEITRFIVELIFQEENQDFRKFLDSGGKMLIDDLNIPTIQIACAFAESALLTNFVVDQRSFALFETVDFRPFKEKCTSHLLESVAPLCPNLNTIYLAPEGDIEACLPVIKKFRKLENLYIEGLKKSPIGLIPELRLKELEPLPDLKFLSLSHGEFLLIGMRKEHDIENDEFPSPKINSSIEHFACHGVRIERAVALHEMLIGAAKLKSIVYIPPQSDAASIESFSRLAEIEGIKHISKEVDHRYFRKPSASKKEAYPRNGRPAAKRAPDFYR